MLPRTRGRTESMPLVRRRDGCHRCDGCDGPDRAHRPHRRHRSPGTATVTVVVVGANQTLITADCGLSNHAIGGGGRTTRVNGSGGSQAANFQGSHPSNAVGLPASGTNPRFWTATFFGIDPGNQVFALCVPD